MNHLQIWNHVDGPSPEDELLDPSEIAILSAKDCCHALGRMAEAHGNAKNELATYVEEVTMAVTSIQMLTWESIRVDRFSLTPPELYYDIVGNARSHLARRDEEAARRRARLADMPAMQPEGEADAAGAEADAAGAEADAERHDEAGYVRILPNDRYDIDIDREFKGFLKEDDEVRKVRKPLNWQRAVDLATEVLLNEMRALLETAWMG